MNHKYFNIENQRLQEEYGLDGHQDIIMNRPDKLIYYGDVSEGDGIELHLLAGDHTLIGLPDTSVIKLHELLDVMDLDNAYARVGGEDEYQHSIVDDLMDFSTPSNVTFPIHNDAGRNWLRVTSFPVSENAQVHAFHITVVTKFIRYEEEIYDKTHHDSLTGLFNKYALDYHYGLRYKWDRFHVMYLDLDNFKELNDKLGHREGNKYLMQFGRILQQFEHDYSRFYRIGGDEFVGFFYNESHAIETVAQCIVKETIELSRKTPGANTTVTIGIVKAMQRDDVIRKADMVMLDAKRKGKNRYLFMAEDELER